jgi:hypothetical protein
MPQDDHIIRLRDADHPWPRRHEIGKTLRRRTPRESHADNKPVGNRPDPLDLLAASNVGRQGDFIPLRIGRMAASPFAFLRGAACVMAWDLSKTPTTGIRSIIDGDARRILLIPCPSRVMGDPVQPVQLLFHFVYKRHLILS